MNLLQEFRELIRSVTTWLYFLIGFSFFYFIFPLERSFSIIVFENVRNDLLPTGIKLIVTNPLTAFLTQIQVAIILAFLTTLPILVYKLMKYFLPALFGQEKKIILSILFVSVPLFFSGAFFAYLYLLPTTFRVLYPYTSNIGAEPFFSVTEFISWVSGLIIATGVMFLLPIFMGLLNFLKIVGSDFWRRQWRYAFLSFLIFSAIITPDGTGITMMLLYGLGMIIRIN